MNLSFKTIRERVNKMPPGEHVSDKKVGKYKLMVHKHRGKYDVYVDGDKLDTYRSQREAERMGNDFIKQLGR